MVVINRRDEILRLNGSELSAPCSKQMACPKGWWEGLLVKRSVHCVVSRLGAGNSQWNIQRADWRERRAVVFLGSEGSRAGSCLWNSPWPTALPVRVWWEPSCWQAATHQEEHKDPHSTFLSSGSFWLSPHCGSSGHRARCRRNYLEGQVGNAEHALGLWLLHQKCATAELSQSYRPEVYFCFWSCVCDFNVLVFIKLKQSKNSSHNGYLICDLEI